MKKNWLLLFCIGIIACQGPEPRRPVKVKTGSFMKESAERSRQLLAQEEGIIQGIIKNDSLNQYLNSTSGSWYYYNVKVPTSSPTPKPDDLVTMAYNVLSFENDTIYSAEEIGIKKYKVDKQELFPGLRNAVKLLKEGETATFLFPSARAYGYHGDNKKIGTNVPIKSTISIFKIEQEQDSIQN
ncbi:gliding motility-associated peptidyl-prolyl isomerase GldI [Muriicola sp. Z0-33]|uniref:gliding motility-associated peptidyl-prolyl isomerase GldI n=1 Tax=Muriicola sp. Z0-33 TaxID=2816957 RepID=UPI002237C5A9|nr:gliding motility-associated peptidyl-prolyl isomerase GldI [Muriicola sp. Z0-33]MCW5515832.1 gliding motility-associated peptidyl-prolyl isomerase GldI [Muriicola sp. Z0-33]